MYMGMEVEFDFEVPSVEEFSRRLCKQVETNIENIRREERVQKKRRELRERIKVQIITSPYTMTPRASIIDSNRRDSMTLPHERGTFTPFQRVPFKRHLFLDSKTKDSESNFFDSGTVKISSAEGLTMTSGEQLDEDVRSSFLSTSTSKIDNETYASSAESLSSRSSFSAICSPPTRSLSPKLSAQIPSKSLFEKERDDYVSLSSTLLTAKSDAFVMAVQKNEYQRRIGTGKTKETLEKEEEMRNAIPDGSEYIQAEFFWVVDYRGTEKTFDSDAFTFAGTRFRLTFSPNTSVTPHKSAGYSLLLALAQSHGRAYVACEFSVHGLLRPTFCRKCTRNLHFTPRSSVYRGYKHFMGPELLSYLENGTFTFSITMKTYIGPKGELLGLPDPLGGIVPGVREADNDSEVASYAGMVAEEECRMDTIYPPQSEHCFYRSGSNLRHHTPRHSDVIGNNDSGVCTRRKPKVSASISSTLSGLASPAGDAQGSARRYLSESVSGISPP